MFLRRYYHEATYINPVFVIPDKDGESEITRTGPYWAQRMRGGVRDSVDVVGARQVRRHSKPRKK